MLRLPLLVLLVVVVVVVAISSWCGSYTAAGGDSPSRDSLHDRAVQPVGVHEGGVFEAAACADGKGGRLRDGGGERAVWECGRGGGGGVDDAVGCAEDEVDGGEEGAWRTGAGCERGGVGDFGAGTEGGGVEGTV